ncbi:LPS export ABC transporter periplasmic protein LptC [Ichthyenterobacterium sp. W332]|uniref:LPS export ABC transporter periplasmic protein LptC n=1 Tax=Microcosmobacter mediterraneus TaxID=3075607 RepID=A0ABU2YN57_9FLAO|nr:LPS export ABC transporter periplasmic protein LptC [Ichthyenterobacterium sp. W332]MDT0558493.1 LPS export ABC transporter periplasmic protein LptC [Ichthyenterobacterium sp. W332]
MKLSLKHIITNIAMVITMAMFFQCKNNFKEVQQIGMLQNAPIGVAEDINLKYTDSGAITANLISPKMLDYSNRDFGYSEFPEGINLILFDKDARKTIITSDYAVQFNESGLIDLRGNVVVASHTKDSLFTEQLYYNQEIEWLFTDKPFEIKSSEINTYGLHLDSDIDFKDKRVIGMNDSDLKFEN